MSVQLDSAVGERLKFGEFELAPDARSLWRHGEEIRLGSRALDILIALATRPAQIVSKDDLTQMVWRGAFVDETALRVGISAVRKALGNGGDRYIATVPGRGYCFVRDVETTAVKPTAAPPHFERLKPQRLPTQIARVFGRDEIIATLAAEATRRRLLSLAGAGGIGKTTVALELARKLDNSYKDHAHFVDLASLADPRLVPTAVASTFEFQTLSLDPLAELVVLLQDKEALLVLDNCEHLIEAVAVLTERIIAETPGVHILATSREPLRAAGEWVAAFPLWSFLRWRPRPPPRRRSPSPPSSSSLNAPWRASNCSG